MERAFLNREDLQRIEALVGSPAYSSFRKLIDHHQDLEMNGLVEAEGVEVHRIQGRIRGLDLLKNLPLIMADQSRKLDALEKQKEEAAEAKKRRTSRK